MAPGRSCCRLWGRDPDDASVARRERARRRALAHSGSTNVFSAGLCAQSAHDPQTRRCQQSKRNGSLYSGYVHPRIARVLPRSRRWPLCPRRKQ